jgi:DNA (cytosine-5)-methyltransferase 1
MNQLVLSTFSGADLLGMAFEQEGFCVVSAGDIMFGRDIREFHPVPGRFDGVIGGPPCKGESKLANLNGKAGITMRDEFARVVNEAAPQWWVMEAVKEHRDLGITAGVQSASIPGYHVYRLNNRWLGQVQSRKRFFHSNLPLARFVETEVFEPMDFKYAVLAGHGGAVGSIQRRMAKYSLPEACELQGLPRDFTDDLPFTRQWKYEVVGNGVPIPMGRAIAKAVKEAIQCEP